MSGKSDDERETVLELPEISTERGRQLNKKLH